jgi:hypothetical protein
MLNEGVINGERLFPAEVVRNIRAGGDPSKFVGFPTIPNGSYTSQWWVFHNKRETGTDHVFLRKYRVSRETRLPGANALACTLL